MIDPTPEISGFAEGKFRWIDLLDGSITSYVLICLFYSVPYSSSLILYKVLFGMLPVKIRAG